jgi:uncharacterized membrane-anchored protein YhcB (DUF1043 family)
MMGIKVDTLLDIKEHIAAFSVLASGEFKAEIEQLSKLKKEIDAQASLVDTKKKLDTYKEQADAYFSSKFDEADKLIQKQEKVKEDFAKKVMAFDKEQADFEDAKNVTAKRQADKEQELVERARVISNTETSQGVEAAKLVQLQKALSDRADALSQAEADLARRLQVLKSI